MNERIKELAKQATKEVWGNDPFNGAPTFEGHELDEEKFAELIINECTDVVIDCDENPKMILHEPYRTIINRINEHFFGVEE